LITDKAIDVVLIGDVFRTEVLNEAARDLKAVSNSPD